MRLDLRQLRHVLALDRYRSFARAADAVGVSQPALSRSLQALELEIGARLFDRDRAGVLPTAVGLRLIALARPLVEQARTAEAELRQMVGLEGGLLRVGSGPFAAELSVGTAVGRLARRHPGIRVDIVTQDWPNLLQLLLRGELDVVIAEIENAVGDERLEAEPLPQHRGSFYCRAGHPLLGLAEPGLQDVLNYPIVFGVVPRRIAGFLRRADPGDGTNLPVGAGTTQFRVESLLVARKIVLESDVVGVAIPSQIERERADGVLAFLPIQVPWLETNYGIIRLAGRTPPPASSAFAELLRGVESELEAANNSPAPRPPRG